MLPQAQVLRKALFVAIVVKISNLCSCCSGFSIHADVRNKKSPIRSNPRQPDYSIGRLQPSTKPMPIVDDRLPQINTDDSYERSIPSINEQNQHRRTFVASAITSAIGYYTLPWEALAVEEPPSMDLQPRRIIRLSSGLQFSDARVGSGSFVRKTKLPSIPEGVGDIPVDDPNIVLMHLRGLRRDGSVLLDTREEGSPILFQLGSLQEEIYYINEGSALAKGRIPLGVQDAILAQGAASWEGGFGKADPMRTGGVRMVVVPSELAYGTKGVSRYEAFQLGLKSPVARNEILRYEIELFRCNDDMVSLGTSDDRNEEEAKTTTPSLASRARACCLEEFYPCSTAPPPK